MPVKAFRTSRDFIGRKMPKWQKNAVVEKGVEKAVDQTNKKTVKNSKVASRKLKN